MAKPDLPYIVGHEFSVVEHVPPQPLGDQELPPYAG